MHPLRPRDHIDCSKRRNDRETGGSTVLEKQCDANGAIDDAERKYSASGVQFESVCKAAFM